MAAVRSCLSALPREWKAPKAMLAIVAFELAPCVAALALFGISEPNLYRDQFWQEGSDHGWNSNPNTGLYAAANHRPYTTPLPWRQFTTNWNVVVSILSVFILLVKGVMIITHVFHPLLSLFIHSGLAAVWAVAIYNQAAPDMSDPKHPQPGAPWYITKSCGPPVRESLQNYCKQAKAAFAVSVILLTIDVVWIIITLVTLYPTKSFRAARKASQAEDGNQQPWEMLEAPKTPRMMGALRSPTTPRTKAFNTLSGNSKQSKQRQQQTPRQGNQGIQLRHHISMGDDVYPGQAR